MLAEPGFEPRWAEGLPIEDYHSDRTSVSSTGLRNVFKSPAKFKAIIDGKRAVEETDAMRFGTMFHMALLEGQKFLDRYVVMPEFSGYTQKGELSTRSKDAAEKKQRWIAEQMLEGKLIVTQKERDRIAGMIESVLDNEDALALLKGSIPEMTGYFACPDTGIKCRLRPDAFSLDLMALTDVKTTARCDPDSFSWRIWDMRYDMQLAMYADGAEKICGRKVDFCAFIAIETDYPHECAVYTVDAAALEIGLRDYRKALKTLRTCIDSDVWPRRRQRMQDIGLPYRALQD